MSFLDGIPRPVERQPAINEKLARLWARYPDLRLGQIISNVAMSHEPFYIEDDTLEQLLDMALAGAHPFFS